MAQRVVLFLEQAIQRIKQTPVAEVIQKYNLQHDHPSL